MYTIELRVTNRPPNQPAYSWDCPLCEGFGTGDNLQLQFVSELAQHHLVRKHGVIAEFELKTIKEEPETIWHAKKVNIELTLDTIYEKDRSTAYVIEDELKHAFSNNNVITINKIITNIRDIN